MLTLKIPEDVEISLKIPRTTREKELMRQLAIRLYEKGILGFGKASKLADMDYWEFKELLYRENVALNYDVEELEKDLKNIKEL